ncbi:glycosyltransferase family 4 protein [Brevundimonas sp.]|uniref:glycosyltransferase family 4 protein n=1 Tax=Brevundimonas sp. TaxID=1871086 RepID=UPI003518924A
MTRVCIDGFNIGMAKGTGIATYGRNLLRNLNDAGLDTQVLYGPNAAINRKRPILNEIALIDAHTPRDRPVQRKIETMTARLGKTATAIAPSDTVIWPSRGGGRPAASAYWSSPRLFSTANRAFAADRVFTPLSFRPHETVARPDVMHWTTALPCQARGVPNVYTIHDLIPLRLPHTTLDNKRLFLGLCRQIAKKADHIAVVSEATKRDVIDILGVEDDRISVTWQSVGIPPRLLARSDETVAAELASVHQLGWKGYYLYFGAIEPKKNLGRIVEAYLTSGSTRPLVVVGGRAWLDEDETALMHQIRRTKKAREKRIRLYDFLPFSLLVDLIRGARGTLFPSIYEGFGLPVLESMALGTPVVTSTAASLPEVAGDAALMADPYDTAAISAQIRALDADDDLAADLSARGRVQAQKFSPEAYQARLSALYARVS